MCKKGSKLLKKSDSLSDAKLMYLSIHLLSNIYDMAKVNEEELFISYKFNIQTVYIKS